MSKSLVPEKKTTVAYPVPHCVRCSRECEPIYEHIVQEDGTWSAPQVAGGLIISVSGGYGMRIDPDINRKYPIFVLCAECIQAIENSSEGDWFKTMLDETENSNEYI